MDPHYGAQADLDGWSYDSEADPKAAYYGSATESTAYPPRSNDRPPRAVPAAAGAAPSADGHPGGGRFYAYDSASTQGTPSHGPPSYGREPPGHDHPVWPPRQSRAAPPTSSQPPQPTGGSAAAQSRPVTYPQGRVGQPPPSHTSPPGQTRPPPGAIQSRSAPPHQQQQHQPSPQRSQASTSYPPWLGQAPTDRAHSSQPASRPPPPASGGNGPATAPPHDYQSPTAGSPAVRQSSQHYSGGGTGSSPSHPHSAGKLSTQYPPTSAAGPGPGPAAGTIYDYGGRQQPHRAPATPAAAERDYGDREAWPTPASQQQLESGAPPASRIPPSDAIRRLQPIHAQSSDREAYPPQQQPWQRDGSNDGEAHRERESRLPGRAGAPAPDSSRPPYSQYPPHSHRARQSPPPPRSGPSARSRGPEEKSSAAPHGNSSGNDAERSAIRSSLLQKLAAGAGDQVGLSSAQINQVVQVVKLLNAGNASADDSASTGKTEPSASTTASEPHSRYSEPSARPVDVSSSDYGVSLVFPQDAPPPLIPIPVHLRKVAEDGEYVHFYHLLFNSMHPPAAVKVAREEAKRHTGLDVLISDGLTSVRNIHGWLLAWSRFMRCYLYKHPERAMELVRYQCFIVEMSARYSSPAWLSYDTAFRQLVSRKPSTRWDRPDAELFRIWFTDARLRTQPLESDLQQATPRVLDALPLPPGMAFPTLPVLPPPLVLPPPGMPMPPVRMPPVSMSASLAKVGRSGIMGTKSVTSKPRSSEPSKGVKPRAMK